MQDELFGMRPLITQSAHQLADITQRINNQHVLLRAVQGNVNLVNGNVGQFRQIQNNTLRELQNAIARLEQIQDIQDSKDVAQETSTPESALPATQNTGKYRRCGCGCGCRKGPREVNTRRDTRKYRRLSAERLCTLSDDIFQLSCIF